MNADVKQLWVDALRSEKYKQGRGRLRSGDEFCCLGVLADLAPGTCGKWETSDYDFGNKITTYEMSPAGRDGWAGCEQTLLPSTVQGWAGMDDDNGSNPLVKYGGEDRHLADLNDNVGLTFAQLADLIEEQL